MKRSIVTLLVGAALLAANLCAAEEVSSLRGHAVTDDSDAVLNKPTLAVPGGFDVAWEEQPPMIPHPIDKYSIDLRQNGCLKCHSPATYEANRAPVVADSHFFDRDGNRTESVAPRRYFCTQCHAAQAGAMPLVENIFPGRLADPRRRAGARATDNTERGTPCPTPPPRNPPALARLPSGCF